MTATELAQSANLLYAKADAQGGTPLGHEIAILAAKLAERKQDVPVVIRKLECPSKE